MRATVNTKLVAFMLLLGVLVVTIIFINTSSSGKYPEVPDLLTNVPDFVPEPVIGEPDKLVPNTIHMIHFGSPDLTFYEVVTIKAAHVNQKPDKLYIHTDQQKLEGKYWEMVKAIPEIELRYKKMPTHIFGQRLDSVFHASDVARLEIMMENGGIYIDSDTYIVSSLNEYRKYEFAIPWDHGLFLGTQLLIANRNARFLKLWYDSYKYYVPQAWYYNAGELPTVHILRKMPSLVKRVDNAFGVEVAMKEFMYDEDSDEWRMYKAIHYMSRHSRTPTNPITDFNEENIKTYKRTFGRMARLVLYGTTDIIE